MYPAAIGGLAGAVAGWLLFGWASRRTQRPHPARVPVNLLFGVAMFLWWLPVLVAVPSLVSHQLDEPHPQWHPLWEWLGQPFFSLFFLVGTASARLGLALAAGPRRNTDVLPTTVTG